MNKLINCAMIALASCGEQTGTKEASSAQSCSMTARFTYPDGSVSTYTDCEEVLVDATYEFDPDKPPQVRSFNVQFSGTDETTFNCWLRITARGLCGSGLYAVGPDESTQLQFETSDCSGVADQYEGEFVAQSGIHNVYRINAGDDPGNFEAEALYTEFRGDLQAETASGIQIAIENYTFSAYIRGTDADETVCQNQD